MTPKIAPAPSELDFTVESSITVILTPAIAEEYLAAVIAPLRAVNEPSLARLLTDIRTGNYVYTSDPIKFDVDGNLIDGLVRLHAIIKSNESLLVTIATGVDPVARHVIDTQAKFSLAQSLELEGVKHAGNVAAALKAIQAWDRGDHLADPDPFRGATTNRGSLAFLAANPSVETVASDAAKLSKRLGTLTTKQLAAFIWAFDKLSRDDRTLFFTRLENGVNTGEKDPIYQLRELLTANSNTVDKLSTRTVNALVIKAWNSFRTTGQVKTLKFIGGGSKPETFPTPK